LALTLTTDALTPDPDPNQVDAATPDEHEALVRATLLAP